MRGNTKHSMPEARKESTVTGSTEACAGLDFLETDARPSRQREEHPACSKQGAHDIR